MDGTYDSQVLERYARRLERRAGRIAFTYGLLGLGGGLVLSSLLGHVGTVDVGESLVIWGLSAFVGYLVGVERGFGLRVQAQAAPCQVQIELNTRSAR